jgi:hypothetical protein
MYEPLRGALQSRHEPRLFISTSIRGGDVKRLQFALRNALGVAAALFAGYVVVSSIPDLRCYIKMMRM